MSNVTLDVAGRKFTVACGEGEEPHIEKLGRMIDEKLAGMPHIASQSEARVPALCRAAAGRRELRVETTRRSATVLPRWSPARSKRWPTDSSTPLRSLRLLPVKRSEAPFDLAPGQITMPGVTRGMGYMLTTVIVAAIIVVIALVWGVAIYNRLVRLRALVKEGFSGITVQLRRRADLVPNLVSTVQGYAAHEKTVLTEVTAHRADAANASGVAATAQADNAFTGMLGRLMAVAEAYPELKADANFRQLQSELTEIEEQLQSARRYYNATVRDLNSSDPVVSRRVVRPTAGFQRGGILRRRRRLDPAGAAGQVRRSRELRGHPACGCSHFCSLPWRSSCLAQLRPTSVSCRGTAALTCAAMGRWMSPRRSGSTPKATRSSMASSAISRRSTPNRAGGCGSDSTSQCQRSTARRNRSKSE